MPNDLLLLNRLFSLHSDPSAHANMSDSKNSESVLSRSTSSLASFITHSCRGSYQYLSEIIASPTALSDVSITSECRSDNRSHQATARKESEAMASLRRLSGLEPTLTYSTNRLWLNALWSPPVSAEREGNSTFWSSTTSFPEESTVRKAANSRTSVSKQSRQSCTSRQHGLYRRGSLQIAPSSPSKADQKRAYSTLNASLPYPSSGTSQISRERKHRPKLAPLIVPPSAIFMPKSDTVWKSSTKDFGSSSSQFGNGQSSVPSPPSHSRSSGSDRSSFVLKTPASGRASPLSRSWLISEEHEQELSLRVSPAKADGVLCQSRTKAYTEIDTLAASFSHVSDVALLRRKSTASTRSTRSRRGSDMASMLPLQTAPLPRSSSMWNNWHAKEDSPLPSFPKSVLEVQEPEARWSEDEEDEVFIVRFIKPFYKV